MIFKSLNFCSLEDVAPALLSTRECAPILNKGIKKKISLTEILFKVSALLIAIERLQRTRCILYLSCAVVIMVIMVSEPAANERGGRSYRYNIGAVKKFSCKTLGVVIGGKSQSPKKLWLYVNVRIKLPRCFPIDESYRNNRSTACQSIISNQNTLVEKE